MRILVCTQAVDTEDRYLGFFVEWLRAFSEKFEHIHVVCLKEGTHELPGNVRVHSLGKESIARMPRFLLRFVYIWRLKLYAWGLRREYDAVFVHMNQEYVFVCGAMWMLLGKPIHLWRNHYAGNWLTDIAVALATKVFFTSTHSYTAKFEKAVIMPVGIDTDLFSPQQGVQRVPRSILFYSRLAPSKNAHVLLDALELLSKRGVALTATIRGTPLPKDEAYAKKLHDSAVQKGLTQVRFEPGLPHREGPAVFSAADIYVNLGDSGMYDKMIFEAAASGALALAASDDYAKLVDARFTFRSGDARDLADKIETLLSLGETERAIQSEKLRRVVIEHHSLHALADSLFAQMSAA